MILLQPTRELRLRLSIGHLLPGIVLLLAGISSLRDEGPHVLAIAEIVAGAAVPIAVLFEYLKPSHGEREAVGWVEVFAGLMLIVEGAHARHPGRLFQPALLYVLAGTITLAFGFGYARVPRIRRIELDTHGFRLRTSPLRRIAGDWESIAGYEAGRRELRLVMRDGRRRTAGLRSVANHEEVLGAFAECAKRFGVGREKPADPSES